MKAAVVAAGAGLTLVLALTFSGAFGGFGNEPGESPRPDRAVAASPEVQACVDDALANARNPAAETVYQVPGASVAGGKGLHVDPAEVNAYGSGSITVASGNDADPEAMADAYELAGRSPAKDAAAAGVSVSMVRDLCADQIERDAMAPYPPVAVLLSDAGLSAEDARFDIWIDRDAGKLTVRTESPQIIDALRGSITERGLTLVVEKETPFQAAGARFLDSAEFNSFLAKHPAIQGASVDVRNQQVVLDVLTTADTDDLRSQSVELLRSSGLDAEVRMNLVDEPLSD